MIKLVGNPLWSLVLLTPVSLWLGCGKSTDVSTTPTKLAAPNDPIGGPAPAPVEASTEPSLASQDESPSSQGEVKSQDDIEAAKSDEAIDDDSEKVADTASDEASPLAATSELTIDSDLDQPKSEAETDELAQQPVEPEPEPEVEPSARLLLPTTAGPLIVDLEVWIGDQLLHNAFDARIQQVMTEAAGSEDLTWKSLFDHISGNQQEFGRGAMINSQQRRNLITRYDRNRNRRPEHEEVAKFLFRNSKFAGPFRINGSNQYREFNRSKSALFAAADRNGDRTLDADEIDSIAESLRLLDQNADERLDVAEVASAVGDGDSAWKSDPASRWGDVVMDLSGYVDWAMLSYSLDEMTGRGPFGRQQNAVKLLDVDGNDSIDRQEALELLHVDADIRLRAKFPSSAAGKAKLESVRLCAELEPLVEVKSTDDRISISSESFRLTVSIADLGTARQQIPPAAFAALDADKDGALDETEIPAAALREYSFEDLDQDGDGKLTAREINEGMSPQQPIWNIQVRGRGAETPDAVFAWLDRNQDQFLSTREINDARQRLKEHASKDGSVVPVDIPDSYLIRIGRGDPDQDEQLLALTPPATVDRPNDASDWPRWAQAMDTNRDGEISRQEFPGTSEQFDQLDHNADNFVDAAEIAQGG